MYQGGHHSMTHCWESTEGDRTSPPDKISPVSFPPASRGGCARSSHGPASPWASRETTQCPLYLWGKRQPLSSSQSLSLSIPSSHYITIITNYPLAGYHHCHYHDHARSPQSQIIHRLGIIIVMTMIMPDQHHKLFIGWVSPLSLP